MNRKSGRHAHEANGRINNVTNSVTNETSRDPTLAAPLYAKSAGNPYFLLELNRVPSGQTPPALAELVQGRIDGLPEAARLILQAAAVLETEVDFDTLRRTSACSEEETLNALDLLVEGDFLVEEGRGYEFVHPLVSPIVHDDLSLSRRSYLHRRAAEALQAIHTRDETAVVGRLATHYAQAGDPRRAAHYVCRTSRRTCLGVDWP